MLSQWEYRVVSSSPAESLEGVLNAHGEEGWEVIGVTTPSPDDRSGDVTAVMKRQRIRQSPTVVALNSGADQLPHVDWLGGEVLERLASAHPAVFGPVLVEVRRRAFTERVDAQVFESACRRAEAGDEPADAVWRALLAQGRGT